MAGGVYQIRNLITEKAYVGRSKNVEVRFKDHKKDLEKCRHHCIHLQRSWNKWGTDAFVFEVLEYLETRAEQKQLEQFLLDEFKPIGRLYNTSDSAEGGLGIGQLTEDHKQKISKSLKGRVFTEEHKRKISEAHKGKKPIIVACPHCGKEVDPGNYKRWHFDNCKHKGKIE